MDEVEIESKDVVYIGDNWTGDIEPAVAEGVFAIYYLKGMMFRLFRLRLGSIR